MGHRDRDRDPTTTEAAEVLRRKIAARRDALVARQRRRYSTRRQELIDQLAADYDAVLAIAIRAGAEDTLGTALERYNATTPPASGLLGCWDGDFGR